MAARQPVATLIRHRSTTAPAIWPGLTRENRQGIPVGCQRLNSSPSTLKNISLTRSASLHGDLRHCPQAGTERFLERLIRCTALGAIRYLRWSVQRFKQNSYHGDALPTELTGPNFTCLTWGFASVARFPG